MFVSPHALFKIVLPFPEELSSQGIPSEMLQDSQLSFGVLAVCALVA